jgi:hypothetical protein
MFDWLSVIDFNFKENKMLFLLIACSDVEDVNHDHHDHEVITTVKLNVVDLEDFEQVFTWADPELDGEPVVDSLSFRLDQSYQVSVSFWNELENPAEDLTQEILDESSEHQVFFGGDLYNIDEAGLLDHAYTDQDERGNPIGVENTLDGVALGEGILSIGLRHLPDEDGAQMKTSELWTEWLEDGEANLAGDWDAMVAFPIEVIE